MKILIATAILILAGGLTANAQTGETVTISKEAAIKCLQDSDALKAADVEKAALKQAIDDYKKLVGDLKIEIAKLSGEKTGPDQMVVRLSALLDFAIKNTKKKRNCVICIL